MGKIKLAILVSGSGTNAEAIAKYFEGHDQIQVDIIMSNKSDAYALTRAKNLGIDSSYFGRQDFYETQNVLKSLTERKIDYIILAGFLWLIPTNLIAQYRDKIINIHPSLLPKYGGKGMYGNRVHEAVVVNKEKESGITIHLVDEIYDNGKIIRQEKVEVMPEDTADSLAQKIHQIEHLYFPETIASHILSKT